MSFLSEAWDRLNAATPVFFKKITKWSAGVLATGVALTATPAIPGAHIPEIVTKLGGYMITIGIVGAGVSKLACSDPDELKK